MSTTTVPTAPGRLPLIGHALPLARNPLEFLKSLRDTGELVSVDLGFMHAYVVTSTRLARQVMVTKATSFEKGRLFDRMRPLVGEGLATASGDLHRQHRRLMQPAFHQRRIAGYADVMSQRARAYANALQHGQRIAVEEEMAELTISTLADTMFHTEIGASAIDVVRQDVPVILKTMLIRAVSPRLFDHLPVPANRRFDAATARLRRIIDKVVAETRRTGDPDNPDLLSVLLAARDADTGEGLSDKEVRDELMTILFAGSETTTSTLAWALHELGQHPEAEKKLMDEIDSVVGDDLVTFDHIKRLTYLRHVLDETIRLHGVTMLMRRAIEAVEIDGITIPAGAEVVFSLYAIHRDPNVYDNPDRFDPDRWLEHRRGDIPRDDFVPFGAGNRKCIGDAFAWTQATITLATILRRWRLQPVPGHTPRESLAAMAYPDHVPMTVTARDKI